MRNLPESDFSMAVDAAVEELMAARTAGNLAEVERIEAEFARCIAHMLSWSGRVLTTAVSSFVSLI